MVRVGQTAMSRRPRSAPPSNASRQRATDQLPALHLILDRPDDPVRAVFRFPGRDFRHDSLGEPKRKCEPGYAIRSEEHTSELQSRFDLVCRLLLEKKK